ncbi:S41 family peptidase [Massilia sp. ST3]|uniref:S41 family peptidase n=1 Tax=Massilia sp. ST3 TaxID=2824903 RepID=UPI001B83FFDE|nr:S41 family peptidase [Massilia sp. ST3]MBQ5949898.1 S41 family peptidase [Massilia sp. ST3]
MRILQSILGACLAALLATSPAYAQAPEPAQQADMRMNAESRRQLIDSLVKELKDSYVFPERARQAEAALRARQQRGAYDGIASAQALSEALTRELQAATNDRHLRVSYSAQALPVRAPASAPSPEAMAGKLAMMRSENFGVRRIEHLPFNIGYLELNGFFSAKDAGETIAAAMRVLAHTDALIIDLRENLGGDAATVKLLAGYLFDQPVRLNDFSYLRGERLEQRWSAAVAPDLRYGQKKDVLILTSKETFSAAEDFSYALKNLKRATVVGETTGGGAHPGDDRRLSPHFSVFMPLGRPISPVTQSNWEGVGVTPDIIVPAKEAFRTAQLSILKKMAAVEQDAGRLAYLNKRMVELGAAKAH